MTEFVKLIMNTIGDDKESAESWLKCWKSHYMRMMKDVMLSMTLALLFVWGAMAVISILGFKDTQFDDLEDMIENTLLILGGCLLGLLMAILYGELEVKMKDRIESLKYYAGRIEKEDEECR